MTETRKVSFTLPSGAAFTSEGTDEQIDKDLQFFKTLLTDPAATKKPDKPDNSNGSRTSDSELPLDRLFSQDEYYGVALTAKPKTDDVDADGIVAILYGFAALKKETSVTAMRLQRAAKKSGLNTPRLTRTVAQHAAFVTESGKGKGKRYGLNNPGLTKAVEILKGILS